MVPQYQNQKLQWITDQLDINMTDQATIRNAVPDDFDAVIKLDFVGVAEEKPAYWRGIFFC